MQCSLQLYIATVIDELTIKDLIYLDAYLVKDY